MLSNIITELPSRTPHGGEFYYSDLDICCYMSKGPYRLCEFVLSQIKLDSHDSNGSGDLHCEISITATKENPHLCARNLGPNSENRKWL